MTDGSSMQLAPGLKSPANLNRATDAFCDGANMPLSDQSSAP
jgi:hypothetical protein